MTSLTIATILLAFLGFYALLGLGFAIAFVTRGIRTVDPTAAHASIGVRLILLPASAALWPLLLLKWRHAARSHRP